jgi:hypothetical protein
MFFEKDLGSSLLFFAVHHDGVIATQRDLPRAGDLSFSAGRLRVAHFDHVQTATIWLNPGTTWRTRASR